MTQKKKILILGGGFGGLSCARSLNYYFTKNPEICKDYEIYLIDRNDYQLYTPTLYEIATTSEEIANNLQLKTIVTFPFNYSLFKTKVNFLKEEIIKIDLQEKFVLLKNNQKIDFEFLVIALGSETNYYNIPGLKENSLPLKNLYDALRIREKVLALYHHGRENLKFIIAGAGPTGVEFSGELSLWLKHLNKNSKLERNYEILLLEASGEILPGFSEKIIEMAKKRLSKLKVKIKTNSLIVEARETQIVLKSGEVLDFDLLIWTGGTKAPEILKDLPLKLDSKGRIEVNEEMVCLKNEMLEIEEKIFVLGDSACLLDPKTQRPVPGVARVAIEQGKVVAYNIYAEILNLPKKKYLPKEYPFIIPIGGKWAIAKFGKILIVGFGGWISKGLVELFYLISVLPLGIALYIWFYGLKIFIKND